MEKINIAELLKDCPRGMELDCSIYDGVTLDSVVFESEYHYENTNTYPIKIVTESGFSTRLTKYGQNVDIEEAKCVIFPKGKTTWEGFQKPFKDGDIISDNHFDSVCIFKGEGNIEGTVDFYCGICGNDELLVKNVKDQDEHFGEINEYTFATEEEKQKLFDAIRANGYCWDSETKTLEKLKPKFKIGNKIRYKNGKNINGIEQGVILSITDGTYDVAVTNNIGVFVPIEEQDDWELQPYKEEAMNKVNKAIFDANAQCCDIMNRLIKKETMEKQKKDYEEWFQINYLEFENNDDTWADEVEVNLGKDYEIQIRGDKTFIVKKQLQYPKTYLECCRIIVAKQDRHYYYTKKDKEQDYPNEIRILDQLDHLRMLIICRDAYWKITGEQMGLGKLWEPNWSDPDEKKYCIVITTEGDIKKCIQKITHKILTFPTEEMRDAFYENFKELIEQCKELL